MLFAIHPSLFRSLSVVQSNGDIGADVKPRIRAFYAKWRQTSGALCDKCVLRKLIENFIGQP